MFKYVIFKIYVYILSKRKCILFKCLQNNKKNTLDNCRNNTKTLDVCSSLSQHEFQPGNKYELSKQTNMKQIPIHTHMYELNVCVYVCVSSNRAI